MAGDSSGYFSHRATSTTDFRRSDTPPGGGHGHGSGGRVVGGSRIPAPTTDDLFRLSFDDLLSASAKLRFLRLGFVDEDDFEDFKRELLCDFDSDSSSVRGARRGAGGAGGGGGGGSGESRDGGIADSVTVSDTAERVGRRGGGEGRGRGEADGAESLGSREGWEGDMAGRQRSGECEPPVSVSSPNSNNSCGVSFREGSVSSGGGARAKAPSRRNGVYFEDKECVVDESQRPCSPDLNDGASDGQRCREERGRGKEEEEEDAGGSSTGGDANTPDDGDPVFLMKAGEKRGSVGSGGGSSCSGSRRVSFRNTPERFGTGVETLERFSRKNDDLERPSVKRGSLDSSGRNNETDGSRSPCVLKQESESFAPEGGDFGGDSFELGSSYTSDCKPSTPRRTVSYAGDQTFPREFLRSGRELRGQLGAHRAWHSLSGELEGRSSRPIEIPIRLVSQPVSRTGCSSSRARDLSPADLDGDVGDSGRDFNPEERGDSRRCDGALPPRDPASIPVSVEDREGKDKCGENPSVNVRRQFSSDGERQPAPHDRSGEDNGSRAGDRSDSRYSQTFQPHSQTFQPKRSSLLDNLRRLSDHARPRSGRGTDPWMDLLGGDDSFKEFERVFETINSHRFSRDLDLRRPGSWWRDDGSDRGPMDVGGDGDDALGALHIDEDFLDFFDHDEDFMEFERELENINSNRRSRLLENLHRHSSCDIFEDVKSFCDRSLRRNSSPGSSPKVERRLSATNSADTTLWNSAEEWGLVMNKLRRNSRLLSDQALNSGGDCGGGSGRTSVVDYVPRTRTLPAATSFLGQQAAARPHRCASDQDCQYTCHLHCVPSVTLDCVTVSPGSGEGPVATPTDLPSPYSTLLPSPYSTLLPSPTASAETSLIERRTIVNHHRSPQKQPSSSTSTDASAAAISSTDTQPALRTVPHSVQDFTPLLSSRSSSSPSVASSSLSSMRDPLSGACVSLSTSLSSSTLSSARGSSLSSCVEKDLNQNARNMDSAVVELRLLGEEACDVTNEKDETDSGYRSGTIPEDKLPKAPSQAMLNRMELHRKIQTFNHFVPSAALVQKEDDASSFQGFVRVTLNLIRPITMELGARPPSIYELLTREHIVEQSTQHVAFYMPRDTVKSIHISSKTTTKEVVTGLLKKFHILDHPRKFAMYEQEFSEKNKLVKLRRLNDKDCPLVALLSWVPERVRHYRLVLQENETGEIVWENFSKPELKNFQMVLDREEGEAIAQLQYKYRVMKRIILQRMKELRQEKTTVAKQQSRA